MTFTEQSLEHALIELFQSEGYTHVNGTYVHKELSDVLLREDLKQFLLNQYGGEDITLNEIAAIIRKLELYSSSALYDSNKAILKLVADGFVFKREDKTRKDLFIRLADFEEMNNNLFKVVNQLEIQGYEKRIPDLIVYVNGLPLVVFELKTTSKETTNISDAFTQLTVRYRRDIPELFKYNAFCVISDGVNNKSGSLFAPYNSYYAWRKIDGNESADKDGIDSLFTMIRGLFHKQRLLDVIHNFIYFPDTSNDDTKIVCRYPQYYASNKLFDSVKENRRPQGSGKGGTYFGATGCGKSFTMLFLTRLLMQSTLFSSPTIVLITDRTDLDDQLSAQFTNAKDFIGDDTVVSVETRDELRKQLQGRNSGGVFLTTIQKFTEDTELLSDRCNIICISDEAHRTQTNVDQRLVISEKGLERKFGFARHLHDSLPNATFVGFTGTPVDATLEVFGGVKDAYTMKESVEDKITVRIVYEGRAAKVLLDEKQVSAIEEYYKDCLNAGATQYQVEESKKATTKMEVILGDPDRIKAVARDFVAHYENRVSEGGTVLGKTMFVTSSRPIAYLLYQEIVALRPGWAEKKACDDRVELSERNRREIKPIEKIKLVMTRDKDDTQILYNLLGTKEYRKELDRQFKNENSNFKIAILVDMWLTGFDVPSLDTIYIDKPLEEHSLIQTISRVNRTYPGKEYGLVVDYIGIKSNMNAALRQYSNVDGSDFSDIDKAVVIVKDQLSLLSQLFNKFSMDDYLYGSPLEKLSCLNRAVEYVQLSVEMENRFNGMIRKLRSAYHLCCSSEEISLDEKDMIHFYFAVHSIIHKMSSGEAPDATQMNDQVRKMIEDAIVSEGVEDVFKLSMNEGDSRTDIFSDDYLAKINKLSLPNIKIKILQKLLTMAIEDFKKVNRIKGVDFSKKLKTLVDKYNERKEDMAFASDVLEDLAEELTKLFHDLRDEQNSFASLGIDFEEKAFYDILKAIAKKHQFDYPEDKLIDLSQKIKRIVDDKARYTDWAQRDDIKAELKVDIILTLAEHGYPPVTNDEVFKEVFEQAENFRKYRG
jgi:type I restriction enzyme, R subunit